VSPSFDEAVFRRMVELRRHFHQHPELSYEEADTARTIMAELDRLGIPHRYGGLGRGVVARLAGADPGPTVALRAEMDALACAERTGLPFASVIPDRMHACGHDAHMAMLLGAAALLKASPPPGTVLFVFQPAEERGNGALVILESGELRGVDAIFAGHVTHHYGLGEIMVAEGTISAQSDRFAIHVQGRAGHGARPHEAVDAVVVAGVLITTIQTLVSRETNPLHPSVITIGKVQAGTAHNTIAGEARLEGTIRTTRPETRAHILQGIRRMAGALGVLHNATIDVEFGEASPPVVNTPREAAIARAAAEQLVGADRVVGQEYPSMGAEDFSYYLAAMPGCYVRFGTRPANGEYVPLHSPIFDLDEDVLEVGAAFYERVAREALRRYAAGGDEAGGHDVI